MGKPGAYLTVGRRAHALRPVAERTRDYGELHEQLSPELQRVQASRCMMCGVAFCQAGIGFGGARPSGCPLHNLIPEWNDLVFPRALARGGGAPGHDSPLPEFTSRVCPALCEAACNLGCHDEPETIHDNERAISDWEWAHGGPRRFAPAAPDAPRVAVVGVRPCGPRRGLGARAPRRPRDGGRARGPRGRAPHVRHSQHEAREAGGGSGACASWRSLGSSFAWTRTLPRRTWPRGSLADFDAVVVAAGARRPRGLAAAGFEAGLASGGVVFAVDYLTASTRALLDGGEPAVSAEASTWWSSAEGDTGNDCLGTAVRQGARSVAQLEFLPRPADPAAPGAVRWPEWPSVCKTDYGQEEAIALMGGEMRQWAADTREVLLDAAGAVRGIVVADVDWSGGSPAPVKGSEREIPAQLVLVACGFTGPERDVLDALGAAVGELGLPACEPGTHRAGGRVFMAGDARTGSSLVVSAIADAMACAGEVAQSWGSSHGRRATHARRGRASRAAEKGDAGGIVWLENGEERAFEPLPELRRPWLEGVVRLGRGARERSQADGPSDDSPDPPELIWL